MILRAAERCGNKAGAIIAAAGEIDKAFIRIDPAACECLSLKG